MPTSRIVFSITPVVGNALVATVNVLDEERVDPSVACSVSVTDCAPSESSLVGEKLKIPVLSAVATPVCVIAPVMAIVTVAPALAVPVRDGRLVVTVAPEGGEVRASSDVSGTGVGVGDKAKPVGEGEADDPIPVGVGDELTPVGEGEAELPAPVGEGVRVGVDDDPVAVPVGVGLRVVEVDFTVTVTGVEPVNTFLPPSAIAPTRVASVSRTVVAPAAFALKDAVATTPVPDFGTVPVGRKTVKLTLPFVLSIDLPVVFGEEKNVPGTKSTASTFAGS